MATEIEQIFGFPDRGTDEGGGEGGHYPAGDTVTADRLKLAPQAATTLSTHGCATTVSQKAQIAPSRPYQLFVITCRFFVSINQFDG